jgi:hypothetical protein
VKRDYVEGLADTFDVVPLGAWRGVGRKAAWFSPILVGVHDPDTGGWQSLCRVMSGFSDAVYGELTAFYSAPDNQLDRAAARRVYATGEDPPVWFRPARVWEVKGADLTLSPVHAAAAGAVHPTRGIGLRFPRFLRERDATDKSPEDATTAAEVAEAYLAQTRRVAGPAGAGGGGGGGGGAGGGRAAATRRGRGSDSDGSDGGGGAGGAGGAGGGGGSDSASLASGHTGGAGGGEDGDASPARRGARKRLGKAALAGVSEDDGGEA